MSRNAQTARPYARNHANGSRGGSPSLATAMQRTLPARRRRRVASVYHIVRDQVPFRELGPDWQRKRYSPEHRARRLQRQLEALGYKVNLEQAEQAA